LDILREAIHNAFKHAEASHIALTLRYGEATLVAEVKDNGKGIPGPVTAEGRRAGHWGMVTMRERAQEIGGSLSIDTGPDGTTVTLSAPLR
jgi:signal transduction histidine kinase